MTDPIADMLTRIRNATVPRRKRVDVPASRLKAEVARILQCEGYIHSYKMVDVVVEKWQVPRSMIRIQLKYGSRGEAVISGIKRVSRPGRRVYFGTRAGRNWDQHSHDVARCDDRTRRREGRCWWRSVVQRLVGAT